ncbi:MAG: hypothetical protein ACFFKA_00175 [Candidatus Thorarchaeota archaeon]
MEELVYFVIETNKRLPNGMRIQRVVITENDIEESREDGESDEEVIKYILGDIASEAEQQFGLAMILTEQQFKEVQAYGK